MKCKHRKSFMPRMKICYSCYFKWYRTTEKSRSYRTKFYRNNRWKWTSLYRRQKEECFNHYGRVCKCCGINDERFLTIDHVKGNGAKHRRKLTVTIYRYLIKHNFPRSFQILCFNCNCAKGIYRVCPHKTKR